MAMPQEKDASGNVSRAVLRIGARVNADALAKSKAKPVFEARAKLKECMRARQDADDEVIIADGILDAHEALTERTLAAFSRKMIGELEGDDAPGDQHDQYLRIMDGATAASLLPSARVGRTPALKAFATRIKNKKTLPAVRKLGATLLAAIDAELAALVARDQAQGALAVALKAEGAARLGCVVAVRELAGALTTMFAKEPSRTKGLLGQSVGRRKKGKGKGKAPAGGGEGRGRDADAPTTNDE